MVKQSYPEPGNDQPTSNELLGAILYGGKCLEYRKLSVNDVAAVGFADIADPDAGGPELGALPAGSKAALVMVEASAGDVDKARVVRFRQDGSDPTATEGMPVGDNGSFEIKGTDNLANFKIIGINAAQTHTLRIEFYGEG